MIVEFFSAEIVLRVWRYRSWRAAGDSLITSAASLKALLAFCSPSAAITWKQNISFNRSWSHERHVWLQLTFARASLAASASAAIALCNWTGSRTSFLKILRPWVMEKLFFRIWSHLHFNSFNFDTPISSCIVQRCLKMIWLAISTLELTLLVQMKLTCMHDEIFSLSDKISDKFLVPSIFLSVVWANRRVLWWAFSTLATDTVALDTR